MDITMDTRESLEPLVSMDVHLDAVIPVPVVPYEYWGINNYMDNSVEYSMYISSPP
jgi:hypothetical protein